MRDRLLRQATVTQSKQLVSLKLRDLNKHLLLDKEKQRRLPYYPFRYEEDHHHCHSESSVCSLHNNPTAHFCYTGLIKKVKPKKVNTLQHSSSMSVLQQESVIDLQASETGTHNDAELKSMRLKPVASIAEGSREVQYSEDASESDAIDVCHHKENKHMKQVLVLSSQQFYPRDHRTDQRPKNLSTLSEPQFSILESSNPTLRSNSHKSAGLVVKMAKTIQGPFFMNPKEAAFPARVHRRLDSPGGGKQSTLQNYSRYINRNVIGSSQAFQDALLTLDPEMAIKNKIRLNLLKCGIIKGKGGKAVAKIDGRFKKALERELTATAKKLESPRVHMQRTGKKTIKSLSKDKDAGKPALTSTVSQLLQSLDVSEVQPDGEVSHDVKDPYKTVTVDGTQHRLKPSASAMAVRRARERRRGQGRAPVRSIGELARSSEGEESSPPSSHLAFNRSLHPYLDSVYHRRNASQAQFQTFF